MDTKLSINRNFKRMFVNFMSILVILAMALPVTGSVSAQEPVPWRDEFDGALAEGWTWVNENSGNWGFNDGFLRIDASTLPTGGENLLLRLIAAGDFSIETRLSFAPDTNFQFAGLVIWQDDGHFLQFGRAFCDIEGPCVGNGIYFDYAGGDPNNFAMPVDSPDDAYLRLERRGEMVKAFYSYEGTTWFEIGTHWIPGKFQVNKVGLVASQDYNTPDWDIPADFDYFELTEGWGFLPEGFHDYDSGDVPSFACNAGGWAVDPDDRNANIWVKIDVDGAALSDWSFADQYRPDLEQTGQCAGGNCGFSTSLWGTTSSYEPHTVVAYAQDIPSGEWVQLSNSPKNITCRTYDIYAFDPLTGETRQVTNLRESDEYNPSWSPNWKMVAHDVLRADGSYGIYITDAKTGVSTLLVDGGNDAVWSPNGKWIAFDRAFTDTPHIFIIPATGGAEIVVRENGRSADWAPNGKRLIFTDYGDDSVRTIPVDGGKGEETVVALIGYDPVWSPDGNWIAYDLNGDIWKVQVNIHGEPLGEPIRLTSGPFNDGQPTWSPDSSTIVYHSGFNADWDLWSVPAAGGEPTWLTGAVAFGDYDPSYAKNSPTVGYASFSPNGQAARTWVAAFTYDLPAGYWSEGSHTYHFEAAGLDNTPDLTFDALNIERLYDGTVLLRPWSLVGRSGEGCFPINAINPDQKTQFFVGWTADGSYSEALMYYENLMAKVAWDGGAPVDLVQHEVFPLTPPVDWSGYVCTYTAGPPAMALRVNYGDNWVESFYEAGHAVSLQVTDSEGNVKATAEVVTEPKDFWDGATGFQTQGFDWSPQQPDIQPYDWVYAQVDNGVTAQVQIGEIRGEVNIFTDSISGTVKTTWFDDPVQVECLPWGSGVPIDNKDGGFVTTNGEARYFCSWAGEWDIQPGQTVGVGYFGPDRHWVANTFYNDRTVMVNNFSIEWSQTNPEEVIYLSWKGSDNLVYTGVNPYCPDDLEYFGNSWASENEGSADPDVPFFFASLVGWGTTGTWTGQTNIGINIDSISSGCPGSANIPINTQYKFFEEELKANLIKIQRTFDFGVNAFVHDVRAFIPRLYPADGFTQVLHPNASSDALVTDATCAFGCIAESWDGSWFAIHNPDTGLGMIVQSSSDPIALWLDDDGASFTNSSSILLLQPEGGFTGSVAEIEYLCFYDSSTWTPSLTLPEGCQP